MAEQDPQVTRRDMLGRIFDGLGRPLDGYPPAFSSLTLDVNGIPITTNRTIEQVARVKEGQPTMLVSFLNPQETRTITGWPGLAVVGARTGQITRLYLGMVIVFGLYLPDDVAVGVGDIAASAVAVCCAAGPAV